MIIREIPNFLTYFVSEDGKQVWSEITAKTCRKCCKKLSTYINKDGYYTAIFQKGYKEIRPTVHKLVLLAFHGPKPFEGAECRHLDNNKLNDHFTNLCWGTAQENCNDRIQAGTQRFGNKLSEDEARDVLEMFQSGRTISEIELVYPMCRQTLYNIKNRSTWKEICTH